MELETVVEHFLDANAAFDEKLHNDMYSALSRADYVEPFGRLLVDGIPDTKRNPSFYLNEFGWKMRPLLDLISPLLDHPLPRVRFDVIKCLLQCTKPGDTGLLGRVFLRLDDPEPFIHRAVMIFIRDAQPWQLAMAIGEAAEDSEDPIFAHLGRRVTFRNPVSGHQILCVISEKMISQLVSHSNPVARRLGAGLAVRPRKIVDDRFLELADECDDEEGKQMIEFTRTKWIPKGCLRGRVIDPRR